MPHRQQEPCPTARIKLHGHVASIDREAFSAIAREPVFDDHPRPAGAAAVTFGGLLEPSGPPNGKRPRVRFGAGLTGRVARALEAKGYEVQIHNQLIDPCTDGQMSLQDLGPARRAYTRPRSLFIVRKLVDRIRFIEELSELAPESHVLVIAQNNQCAKEAADRWAKDIGREATWGSNQRHEWPWRHVKSLGCLAGDSAYQWSAVVFLDAESAMTKTATDFLAPGHETIRIAFLAHDVHRIHEAERGALEALFGPVDSDCEFAAGSVAWLRPVNCRPVHAAGRVDRMRTQVWQNRARNNLIARAARAFSDGNISALERLGLHEAAAGVLGDGTGQAPTVGFVAANAEQGRELARLLPGWRLETTGYVPPPGTMIEDNRMIMTLQRAEEELFAPTVVIYAAGGRDWWLDSAQLGVMWGPEGRLVVDVADGFDAESRADVRSRAAGYRHLDYEGAEPGDQNPGMPDATRPVRKEPEPGAVATQVPLALVGAEGRADMT